MPLLAGNSNGDSLGQLGLGLVLHHFSDRLGRGLALALLLLLLGGLLLVGLKVYKAMKSKYIYSWKKKTNQDSVLQSSTPT